MTISLSPSQTAFAQEEEAAAPQEEAPEEEAAAPQEERSNPSLTPTTPTQQCPPGTTFNRGFCISEPEQLCPAGFTLEANGDCRSLDTTTERDLACPEGRGELNAGTCQVRPGRANA